MNKIIASTVSVFLLSSQVALAEIKEIQDSELSEVTGQAGLTIDIEMGIEIGEFMYKDEGGIVIQGFRFGGMDQSGVGTAYSGFDSNHDDGGNGGLDPSGNNLFNNARVFVDVAGANERFEWAWSRYTNPGTNGFTCYECAFNANDGDLIISGGVTDITKAHFGEAIYSVDFGIEYDEFKLKASTYVAGDDIVNRSGTASTAQSTTLYSDFKMEGFIGGWDLIIENNGNGFTDNIADSKIKINTFFKVTEMEYDFDIVGMRYEKLQIHNRRGNKDMFDREQGDRTSAFISTTQGFAQASSHIYAVQDNILTLNTSTNTVSFTDGIGFKTRFVGDMDIGHLSFGDTGVSVGEFYFTDMDFRTTRTLSGH